MPNFNCLKSIAFKTATYKTATCQPIGLMFVALGMLGVVACTPTPPDTREQVTLPVYTQGDAVRGEQLYEETCLECHKLTPGRNKKGPHLIGVYGAPAAALSDYKYSEAMTQTNWVWNAETLDTYIADAEAALPNTRMLSDPMPQSTDRQDIIAYLSTLGRDAPVPVEGSTQSQ